MHHFTVACFLFSDLLQTLRLEMSRAENSPIGPVPELNRDIVPKLVDVGRTKSNFYIPTEALYKELLDHLLVVAHGSAEVIAGSRGYHRELAEQSLFSLSHVYNTLTEFRKKNWFRELPGVLKYASLLSIPAHGSSVFSGTPTEVTKACDEAREAYKDLQNKRYRLYFSGLVLFCLHGLCYHFLDLTMSQTLHVVRETGAAGARAGPVAPATRTSPLHTVASSFTAKAASRPTTRRLPKTSPKSRRKKARVLAGVVADPAAVGRKSD